MDREERSRTHATDTHIDELLQDLEERQRTQQGLADVPELRIAHDIRRAYQPEALEDARSLDRVLAKLMEDQARTQSKPLFLPTVSRQPERISTMQHTLDTSIRGKSSRSWQKPVSLLAAVVFFALLVGGMLTALGVMHTNQTSPTASVTSQVITSVALSDNINQTTQTSTVQSFTVGQTIWLVINVGKKSGSGLLMVKWYENGHLYTTTKHGIQVPKGQVIATTAKAISERTHQVFTQPGDGKVEIYWNGQLVKTLHFVVK